VRFFVLFAAAAATLVTLAANDRASASTVTWRDLAAHPGRYVGKEVEIVSAYCGSAVDDPGFICSTDGALYIRPLDFAAGAAKTKVENTCGGVDWMEKSAFCRVKLRFTPSGFHKTTQYDPDKAAIVIETPQATVSF
jgi:hypothetical protein